MGDFLLGPGTLLNFLARGADDGLDFFTVDETSNIGVRNLGGGEDGIPAEEKTEKISIAPTSNPSFLVNEVKRIDRSSLRTVHLLNDIEPHGGGQDRGERKGGRGLCKECSNGYLVTIDNEHTTFWIEYGIHHSILFRVKLEKKKSSFYISRSSLAKFHFKQFSVSSAFAVRNGPMLSE